MIGLPRRKKRGGPALAIAGSAAFAMLLLGAMAQYWGPGRARVHEDIAPDIAALLPAGSVETTRASLPDSPQDAHVVAYAVGGKEALALIAWDLDQNRYRLVSNVVYGDIRMNAPNATTSLVTESFGLGAPVAVLARGSFGGEGGEIVSVFARNGDALEPVTMHREDGTVVAAQFEVGSGGVGVLTRNTGVSFQDIDGDGDKDALYVREEKQDGATIQGAQTVLTWRGGAFFYDEELSRIMSMRSSLFPEPEAPPEGGQ